MMVNIHLVERIKESSQGVLEYLDSHVDSENGVFDTSTVFEKINQERNDINVKKSELRSALIMKSSQTMELGQETLNKWSNLEAKIQDGLTNDDAEILAASEKIEDLALLSAQISRLEKIKKIIKVWIQLERQIANVEDGVSFLKKVQS